MDYSIFSCKEELMKVGGLGLGNNTKEALSKYVQWLDNQEMKSTYERKWKTRINGEEASPCCCAEEGQDEKSGLWMLKVSEENKTQGESQGMWGGMYLVQLMWLLQLD